MKSYNFNSNKKCNFMHNNKSLDDIKQTAVFEQSIYNVWEKLSTSAGIASWLMANDFEPKIGHEFHLQSTYGPSPCKVIEVDAPNRLSFTWDTDGLIKLINERLKEVVEG